ncbi:peptidase domain-containing ABC transporter [Vibrio sp. Makdt]|uniref:peptidase domain-containing ABC transporter n=1 Tax=Vibrio sp. Makdt TaxID=2998828 RepID=UPI0022CD4E36|nr:peptidase domain-containing ABC transporter [Vibrio sp. Makdt]MDA0155937.1 peptidase domain-containing ABC transporter [Vibrio sp. Makdt]
MIQKPMNIKEILKNTTSLLNFNSFKPVPLILQSELSDCGLACLAMISSYYGHKINIQSLKTFSLTDSYGMRLFDVIETAKCVNLSTRALKCSLNDISKLSFPCILHWDLNHYVVITGYKNGKYYINDPALGKRVLTEEQFSNSFTGVVLEASPNSDFKKEDSKVVMKINQLWSNILGLKTSLISLLTLTVIIQIIGLLTPYYMQWVVDNVLINNDESLLKILAIGFSLLLLVSITVSSFRGWLVIRISSSLSLQMGANLFNHLLNLPISYFEKRHVGDIVSRFGSLSAIQTMITNDFVEGVIDGFMTFIVLIVMYIYSPILSSIVLLSILMSFLVQLLYYYPNRRLEEEIISTGASEDSLFLESIRGIQTLKLFNLECNRLNDWINISSDIINSRIKQGKLGITEGAISSFISSLESILIVYIGASIVMEGNLSVGMLLAFIAYKQQFTSSCSALISKWFSFKMLSLHLERLSDIALEEKEESFESLQALTALKGHIRVDRLGFKYSSKSDWVFRDISFEVRPGESFAIAGASGCGKTTLMKIILGLLKPTEGSVYVDGVDICTISKSSYRNHVAAVMQNDTLFMGSLGDNITLSNESYDEGNLIECCRTACILEEIRALPMQFHTQVGDMGSVFSGGQLQRIFLARALYRTPTILCLDESTSHLDMHNEYMINSNLKEKSMTTIFIAHREQTISSADRVFYLD